MLEILTHAPDWRGVFGESCDGGALAVNAPIALPDLDGTGDTLDASPRTVEAVRGWFKSQGLTVEAIDVEHAIEAVAFARGPVPYRYLPRALQDWEEG